MILLFYLFLNKCKLKNWNTKRNLRKFSKKSWTRKQPNLRILVKGNAQITFYQDLIICWNFFFLIQREKSFYFDNYESLYKFVESTNNNKYELAEILFPMFLHFYLDMINKDLDKMGKTWFFFWFNLNYFN